jgi:hypothetical protein
MLFFGLVFSRISGGRRRVILADFPSMQNGVQAPLDPTSEELPRVEPCAPQPARLETEKRPVEIGGRAGPEPTRFGDWEKNGRCIDF